ncbi:helix-turn-helix domain-containing protein [Actinoplanes sp. NPDC048796]|uniref:helix-turn-helix domain-containing protein n=1 Tax=Actinoplanes sp. NPDC048796 TaxID=3155640 RepID=UPI0033CF65B4
MVDREPDSLPEAELAQRLRSLRVQQEWSQADLAEHINNIGYGLRWHQTTVAKIEAGQRPIGLNEAAALAEVFDITGAELLMPLGARRARAAKLRAREQQLDDSGDDLDLQLAELAEQQAVARHRVQKIREERVQVLHEIETSATALRHLTEQYENTQQRLQDLSRELDQGLTELINAEKAAEQLRERLAFQQAEIEQVRAHSVKLDSKDDVDEIVVEPQIEETASGNFLSDASSGVNSEPRANRTMPYGKKDLPYPYNQDLVGIVTRIKGVRESTRAALVNSLKVASYLKAGVNLVEQNLGPSPSSSISSADSRYAYWSGFQFLSERSLMREAATLDPPYLRQKGVGPYRSTWASHDDYLSDLLAFQFHAINYAPKYGTEMGSRGHLLSTADSLVEAVKRSAYHELQAILRMPQFRLQLIVSATADLNDGIHNSIANNYAAALEPWMRIYESTLAARGLRLRNGVTMRQFVDMLAAITEGFAIRQLGDPNAGILGEPESNLAGMAILGIIDAYTEPIVKSGN